MLCVFKKIFNVVFPSTCHICKSVTDHPGVCSKCWKKLIFITNPKCKICGFPFEFHDKESDVNADLICPRCIKEKPDFTRAIAVLKYNDASKKIVLPFKHADRTDLRKFVADLMVLAVEAERDVSSCCDFVVPVPLHLKRLVHRKYNQAALLATDISRGVKIPFLNALRRVKFVQSQGHLSVKKRRENIKNCFEVSKKYAGKIAGKNILLVDDVMTTGATANECARVLKKAGAKNVYVLAFCRVC